MLQYIINEWDLYIYMYTENNLHTQSRHWEGVLKPQYLVTPVPSNPCPVPAMTAVKLQFTGYVGQSEAEHQLR